MRRIITPLALAAAGALLSTGPLAAAAAAKPRVAWRATIGGETGLPANCVDLHAEAAPSVGADPADPQQLRAIYQQQGESAVVGAASNDGGRTWGHHSAIADATDCAGPPERQFDVNPLFAVGVGGTAYRGTSWAGSRDGMWAYGVVVHAWDDVHLPWRATVPGGGENYAQNASLAAHPERPGVVHALWTHVEDVPNSFTYAPRATELRFATSSDGGRSFSPYRVVHRSAQGEYPTNGRLAITSGGSLLVVFDRYDAADLAASFNPAGAGELDATLHVTRSTDGGETWSPPVLIGKSAATRVVDPDSDTPAGSGKPDLATGPDGLAAAVSVVPQEGGADAMRLTVSEDGGATWSAPMDPARAPADVIQPAVAIDGQGRLGVFWYDFRADRPGDRTWDLQPRFAVSRDRGRNWRELAVDAPFDVRATHPCTQRDRLTGVCEARTPASHFMALGIQQDVTGLPHGFGVAYTVGPPLAGDDYTDAVYARIEG